MSITRRAPSMERRVFSGGGGYWGPYADGTIPPNWFQGPSYLNSSGVSVNADTALRISAVWACVQLVSDYIAGLPVATVTKKPDGEVVRNGQQPPLLAQPWPDMTQYEWFFAMQSSLMLRGNTYGRKIDFDSRGYPRMIQPVSADTVTTRRVDGRLEYKFGTEIVPNDEVFHLRAFTVPGKDVGVSPIEAFAQTMGVSISAEDFGARFFGDGAHPTAVLQSDQPIDKTQAETILARIRNKFMGGSREPIILGAGTKWQQIQVAPNESQFLETMKFGVNQIARIFGLGMCVELVGGAADGSAITYANIESRSLDLQTYGILPWTERWSQALTPLVPAKPSYVAFDLDARLKVDMLTRYQAKSIGMRAGYLCADDVRQDEGRPPLPAGTGQQFNWPPYNVKNEDTAADVSDGTAGDGTDTPPEPVVKSLRLVRDLDGRLMSAEISHGGI